MSNAIHAAHELIRASDHLHKLKMFNSNCGSQVQGSGIRVEWHFGAAMPGYKELAHDIGVIVSERWCDLRDEAIRRAEGRAEAAHQEMRAALELPE